MSVLYVPANDMLHAFRAGPNLVEDGEPKNLEDLKDCYSPVPHNPDATPSDPWPKHVTAMAGDYDCGGEELWGFVPYDQLGKLGLRYVNEPQGRDNHVFMLARGIRFADIFVPARDATTGTRSTGGTFTKIVDSKSVTARGVWRRMLFFGRGTGGKSMTALDVTGVGAFTRRYCRPRLRYRFGTAATLTRSTASWAGPRMARTRTLPPTTRWARPGRCRP